MRSRGLNRKHLKALSQLKAGLSVDKIAKTSGLKRSQLFNLIKGDEAGGAVAQEFSEEVKRAEEEQDIKIKKIKKDLEEQVFSLIGEAIEIQKKAGKVDEKYLKEVGKLFKSGSTTWNVGPVSYSKGLTGEDLLNEYRRLVALADAALERRPVSDTSDSGTGVLPTPPGRRDQAQTDAEAGSLPAES